MTSDGWALKLRNNSNNSLGAAIGVESSGTLTITRTANNFTTHIKPFAIFSDGTIGVNTLTDRNYNLAVDGTVGVNGTITATKLEIVNPSVIWADYVFKPDYKLMSLTQLEAYIKGNNHLPNVPSAREVEKNGIDVAEMNKVLLEKVEELTLYVIELSKQVDQLKAAKK